MEWMTDPTAWVGLLTLVALEIVLGVDNLIFLAILADKLPPAERDRARIVGLSLALVMRLALLASISWVMSLTRPLVELWQLSISWRDVILIAGGLFLLVKATTEIHERIGSGGQGAHQRPGAAHAAFWPIIAQIIALDAVFSLDSIVTAVGMVDELGIMMTAVVIAMLAMLVASKPLTSFVIARPTLIILCLGFLLMIGLVLVVDGFGVHIPRGYVYAAIGFSLLIEMLNQLAARNRARGDAASRQGVADAVLRLLGGLPLETERRMVGEVLTLGQRTVGSVMTPRAEVTWLDAGEPVDSLLARVRSSPHREFPMARGAVERIVGLVRKEDLLAQCLDGGRVDVERLLRPPLSLREDATVLDALNLFRREPSEMAIVVDEHGGFRGVVTREDVLEAIAGDLPDSGRAQPRPG